MTASAYEGSPLRLESLVIVSATDDLFTGESPRSWWNSFERKGRLLLDNVLISGVAFLGVGWLLSPSFGIKVSWYPLEDFENLLKLCKGKSI